MDGESIILELDQDGIKTPQAAKAILTLVDMSNEQITEDQRSQLKRLALSSAGKDSGRFYVLPSSFRLAEDDQDRVVRTAAALKSSQQVSVLAVNESQEVMIHAQAWNVEFHVDDDVVEVTEEWQLFGRLTSEVQLPIAFGEVGLIDLNVNGFLSDGLVLELSPRIERNIIHLTAGPLSSQSTAQGALLEIRYKRPQLSGQRPWTCPGYAEICIAGAMPRSELCGVSGGTLVQLYSR